MQLILLSILSFVSIYALTVHRNRKRSIPLPPGPPSEPILGHLRVYPQVDQDRQFHEWSKTYGDVMHFSILGKSIVVLNSEQAATDLLHKRSAKYSDRPQFAPFQLFGWDQLLVFMRYGPAAQLEQARVLVRSLLHTPHNVSLHAQRFSAAIIMEIAYGHQVKSDDDRYVQLAKEIDDSVELMSSATILHLFPFLKHLPAWFPGAWFIRYARDTQHLRDEMMMIPFQQVLRDLSTGTAKPSFTSMHIEEMERNGTSNEEDSKMLQLQAMHMWTAGAGTTSAALLTFIFAMLIHPEVQKKAQKEIDEVIGSQRLPDFNDRESLPYVDCVLEECRRWHPVFTLGIPHRATEDDVYNGMYIPKDATIIPNASAMALDERVYHDPHAFRPERFLPEYGEPPLKSGFFGYGRRVCVGRHLADASLWIAAVSILAALDITNAKDEFGNEITPDIKFTHSMISHPEPFACNIQPRTPQAKALTETP